MPKRIKPLPFPQTQELVDPRTLGEFVRARRTQSGLSITEAAAFCGVAVGTLDKIERASGDARLSNVLKVCGMLGIGLRIDAQELPA